MHPRAQAKLAEIQAHFQSDGHDPTDIWPTKAQSPELASDVWPETARHQVDCHALWWQHHKEGNTHPGLKARLAGHMPINKLGWFWKQSALSELAFNEELDACKAAKVAYRPSSYMSIWSEANDHSPEQAARQLLGMTRLQAWRATMAGVQYDWDALTDHQTWLCANLDSWVADAEQSNHLLGKLLRRRPAMLAHSLSNLIYDSCHPPLGGRPADVGLYSRLEPLVTKLWDYGWEHAKVHGKPWMEHVSEVADIWQQITGRKLTNAPIYIYKPVGERGGWVARRTGWNI